MTVPASAWERFNNDSIDETLTPDEVCNILGVDMPALMEMIKKGEIPALYLPDGYLRFFRDDLRPQAVAQGVDEATPSRENEESLSINSERELEEEIVASFDRLFGPEYIYLTRQYMTAAGIVDLLLMRAVPRALVAVELKAGTATSRDLGQLLGYIESVRCDCYPRIKRVDGMLICNHCDTSILYALLATDVKVLFYETSGELLLREPTEMEIDVQHSAMIDINSLTREARYTIVERASRQKTSEGRYVISNDTLQLALELLDSWSMVHTVSTAE